jgi:hypothetical protein
MSEQQENHYAKYGEAKKTRMRAKYALSKGSAVRSWKQTKEIKTAVVDKGNEILKRHVLLEAGIKNLNENYTKMNETITKVLGEGGESTAAELEHIIQAKRTLSMGLKLDERKAKEIKKKEERDTKRERASMAAEDKLKENQKKRKLEEKENEKKRKLEEKENEKKRKSEEKENEKKRKLEEKENEKKRKLEEKEDEKELKLQENYEAKIKLQEEEEAQRMEDRESMNREIVKFDKRMIENKKNPKTVFCHACINNDRFCVQCGA